MNLGKFFNKNIEYSFYLLFFLVPLILTPWNYELFEYNKMMFVYTMTVVIVGAWFGKMIVQKEIRIQKTPLDLPIFLFLGSQILSTVFSIDRHTSLWGYYSRFHGGLMSTISYVLLYYAFVSNMVNNCLIASLSHCLIEKKSTNKNNNKAMKQCNNGTVNCIYVLLFSALLVTFYGILEHLGIDAQYWVQDVKNRVFSTLGQPNWLSAFIDAIICIPIALAINLKFKNQKSKLLFTFYFLLFTFFYLCLLFTGSRSGIFGFLAAFLAFLGLLQFSQVKNLVQKIISLVLPTILFALIFLQEWKGKEIKLIFPSLLIFGSIYLLNIEYLLWAKMSTKDLAKKINLFLLIFALSSLIIGTPISPSLTKLIKSKTNKSSVPSIAKEVKLEHPEMIISESSDIRKVVWQGAINVWRHWPIFGSGVETFAYSFYNFRPRAHNDLSEWDFLYNKAHNEYLNFLATTGIVGLGTYLLLIGWFLFWSLKKCKIQKSKCKMTDKNAKFLILNCHFDIYILIFALLAGYLSILVTNFFGFSVVIIGLFFFLFPAFCFILTNSLDSQNSYLWTFGSAAASNINLAFQNLTKKQRRKLKKQSYKLQAISYKLTTYQYLLLIILLFTFYFLLFTLIKMWRADYFFSQADKYKDYNLITSFQDSQKAIQLNPHEALYHEQMAKTASRMAAAYQQTDASSSAQIIKQLENLAVYESNKTLAMNKAHLNFYKSQAQVYLYLSLINPDYKLKARETLLEAIKLSPTDAKLYFNLGKLYEDLGDLTNAIEYLKKTVELKPNYRVAHSELAKVYEKAGLIDQAIAEYQFNLEMINPEDKVSKAQIEKLKKQK